jgi:hypothetical protein
LKGTGFSPSVESKVKLPALAAEGMQVAAKKPPQRLKPHQLPALIMYGLKPVPFAPKQVFRQIP